MNIIEKADKFNKAEHDYLTSRDWLKKFKAATGADLAKSPQTVELDDYYELLPFVFEDGKKELLPQPLVAALNEHIEQNFHALLQAALGILRENLKTASNEFLQEQEKALPVIEAYIKDFSK